jgi:hypothetical protein
MKQVGMSSDSAPSFQYLAAKYAEVIGREVGKFAGCQVCPEVFDGIEFRGISRETIRSQPSLVSFKEMGCFPAAMGGKSIPNKQYPATNVATDVEKETFDGFGVDIAGNDGEEETAIVAVMPGGDGAYAGETFPVERLDEHGGFPARRPRSANAGALGIAAFVQEKNGGVQTAGFFLIRGHSSFFHG